MCFIVGVDTAAMTLDTAGAALLAARQGTGMPCPHPSPGNATHP